MSSQDSYLSKFYFGKKILFIFIAKGLLSYFGLDSKGKKSGPSSEGTVYFFLKWNKSTILFVYVTWWLSVIPNI